MVIFGLILATLGLVKMTFAIAFRDKSLGDFGIQISADDDVTFRKFVRYLLVDGIIEVICGLYLMHTW